MRVVKTAVASSLLLLLLLTACSQPPQESKLTGIVQLTCTGGGSYNLVYEDDLIVDTENWRLLSYDGESDSLKERTIEPYLPIKGMDKTWKINKKGNILTITYKAAFSKDYFDERARKRAIALRNGYTAADVEPFDIYTEGRRKDQMFARYKINIKTLDAELYEKVALSLSTSRDSGLVEGTCRVSEPPTRLVSAD